MRESLFRGWFLFLGMLALMTGCAHAPSVGLGEELVRYKVPYLVVGEDFVQVGLEILRTFLDMDQQRRCYYMVGRRMGIFNRLSDMESPHNMARVEQICKENSITPDNVNKIIDEAMKRFI